MTDMLVAMACWKGTYYIQCRDEYRGLFIEPIEGYIIRFLGDHYGFTRGFDGMFIVTDCYTGARVYDIPQIYNLMAAFRELKKFALSNMAMMEKIRSSRIHREAVAMIREAYRRDFAKATGGGTNG